MKLRDLTRQGLAVAVATQLVLALQLGTAAQAGMISTDTAISRYADQADRGFLLQEIRKSEVRDRIVALGVDPAEAEARLQALSDEEVAAMVQQMDDDTAGAGVIGALLTVFLILLVTDLLCLTKVFNFTRCAVR